MPTSRRHHPHRAGHRVLPLPQVELRVRAADPGGARRPAPAHQRQQPLLLHAGLHQLREPLSDEGRECSAEVHQAAGAPFHPTERGRAGGRGGVRDHHPRQDAGQRAQAHREPTGEDGDHGQKRVLVSSFRPISHTQYMEPTAFIIYYI